MQVVLLCLECNGLGLEEEEAWSLEGGGCGAVGGEWGEGVSINACSLLVEGPGGWE